jgi:sugar lactone lactonase YvrE
MTNARVVAEGLYFGEGPRWHEDRLWFSDFYDRAVKSLGADGDVRIEVQLEDQPSGLGWLPDGRLLVVAMQAQQLLRLDPDGPVVHADLAGLAVHLCNDMAVDGLGRAWVGNFGFDLDAEMEARGVEAVLTDHPTANLVRVDPDGAVHLAAPGMHFPNGTVVTPDGKTLIVAETLGLCLTAFDIAQDGTLSNRRQWAPMGLRAPDGICLDENGNVWVANALAPECVLVAPGGDILATVATSQNCYACMLGGADGRDLYLVTSQTSGKKEASAERTGKIELARANAARAGWP